MIRVLTCLWSCFVLIPGSAQDISVDSIIMANTADTLNASANADRIRKTGLTYRNTGKYTESIQILEYARELYDETNDQAGVARCLNNLASVYWRMGDKEKAFDHIFNSLRINISIENQPGLLRNHINVGSYYSREHKYHEADRHYQEARRLAQELKDTLSLAMIYAALGNIYSEEKGSNDLYDKNTSLSNYTQSITYFRKMDNLYGFCSTLQSMGVLYEDEGELDSALYYYNLSLNGWKELGDSYAVVNVLFNLGNVAQKTGNYEEALIKYQQALEGARNLGAQNQLQRIYYQMANVRRLLGQYEKSINDFLLYDSYKDSVYNETSAKQIAELQTRYETERKDSELKLRQAKIDVTTAERDTLMYTLLVAVILTFVIIFIYNQRQNMLIKLRLKESQLHEQAITRMIQDQELKAIHAMLSGEEKERKRIAEDLHDRVGSMLSAAKLQVETNNHHLAKLLDETAEEVRRVSHNLETKVLNSFGLGAALKDLADKIGSSNQVTFDLHLLDLDERLNYQVEIYTYRIVQELVSNALRHSKATEIITQVNRIDHQLLVMVEDNGVGFSTLKMRESHSGMGLKNINSRVGELEGSLHIDSVPGKGTTVTVEIPI